MNPGYDDKPLIEFLRHIFTFDSQGRKYYFHKGGKVRVTSHNEAIFLVKINAKRDEYYGDMKVNIPTAESMVAAHNGRLL